MLQIERYISTKTSRVKDEKFEILKLIYAHRVAAIIFTALFYCLSKVNDIFNYGGIKNENCYVYGN